MNLEHSLTEKIVKKGNKWQVQSEKGRNMGTYDTKEEAEKRLKQVEYFKHLDEVYDKNKGPQLSNNALQLLRGMFSEQEYQDALAARDYEFLYMRAPIYLPSLSILTVFLLSLDLTPEEILRQMEYTPASMFAGMKGLLSITIPASIETIGETTFVACSDLKQVKCEEGVEYIQAEAFAECSSLERVELPDSLLFIEPNAFEGCENIKYLRLPDSEFFPTDKIDELIEPLFDTAVIEYRKNKYLKQSFLNKLRREKEDEDESLDEKLDEDFSENKIFSLVDIGNDKILRAVDDLIKQGYQMEVVPLETLVKDNNLASASELAYHKNLWQGNHKDWKFDLDKAKNWLYSDVISATQKADGRYIIDNGKHRCWALYNSGFDAIELPVLREVSKDESIKEETKMDKKALGEDIEKHDELNPKLFDGEELKPEVKEAVEKIADTFVRGLQDDGIRFDLKDIVLIGSNVSYNYTKDSDLDIHLIADSKKLDCPHDLYPLLYSAYRSLFNKDYDIIIKGIPAELYVELDEPQARSNGIYSLKNGWLKKPVQQNIPDLDKEAFDKLFKDWKDKYDALLAGELSSEKIYDFIEDLYDLRKGSISKEGEYGLGNLIFKEFRNRGWLDYLKDLVKEEKSKELSLEKLEEDLKYGIRTEKFNELKDWIEKKLDLEINHNKPRVNIAEKFGAFMAKDLALESDCPLPNQSPEELANAAALCALAALELAAEGHSECRILNALRGKRKSPDLLLIKSTSSFGPATLLSFTQSLYGYGWDELEGSEITDPKAFLDSLS